MHLKKKNKRIVNFISSLLFLSWQILTLRLDKQLLRKTCHLFRNSCFWLTHSRQVTRGYKAWEEGSRGYRMIDISTNREAHILCTHWPRWTGHCGRR
jgi:hypothetical protein